MLDLKELYVCEVCGQSEYLEGEHTIICICGHIQTLPDDISLYN